MSRVEKKLKSLRRKIDRADRALLRALGDRQATVARIGKLKAQAGIAAHQKSRWAQVIRERRKLGQKRGLGANFTEAVFNLIHAESLRIQKRVPPRKPKRKPNRRK